MQSMKPSPTQMLSRVNVKNFIEKMGIGIIIVIRFNWKRGGTVYMPNVKSMRKAAYDIDPIYIIRYRLVGKRSWRPTFNINGIYVISCFSHRFYIWHINSTSPFPVETYNNYYTNSHLFYEIFNVYTTKHLGRTRFHRLHKKNPSYS